MQIGSTIYTYKNCKVQLGLGAIGVKAVKTSSPLVKYVVGLGGFKISGLE